MASPAAVHLTWVAGDDEIVQVTICSDADGLVPVDITGRTYTMSVDALALAGAVTGGSGLVTFTATDTQTTAMDVGTYPFDVVEVSGSTESTLILGWLVVVARVTA